MLKGSSGNPLGSRHSPPIPLLERTITITPCWFKTMISTECSHSILTYGPLSMNHGKGIPSVKTKTSKATSLQAAGNESKKFCEYVVKT